MTPTRFERAIISTVVICAPVSAFFAVAWATNELAISVLVLTLFIAFATGLFGLGCGIR